MNTATNNEAAYVSFGETANSEKIMNKMIKEKMTQAFGCGSSEERMVLVSNIAKELGIEVSEYEMAAVEAGVIYDDYINDFIEFEKNHIDDNASLDGTMFETYAGEIKYIKEVYAKEPSRVWTYMEDDEVSVFTNGFHLVNRIGYLVAKTSNATNLIFMENYSRKL